MLRGLSLALVVTAVLAACGSGDAVSVDPVADAAVRTQNAGSARFSLEGSVRVSGQRIGFTGGGIVDMRTNSARAHARYSFPPAIEREIGPNPTADLIMDGRDGYVMYMRVSFAANQLPPGKEWVRMDLAELGKQYGVNVADIMQARQSDPTQILKYLQAAGDVERVGSELVRHEATTRYRAIIDLQKVADQAPPSDREAVRESIDKLIELTGVRSYPAEAWIGQDGLLRRFKLNLDYNLPTGERVEMAITEELYDFGLDVDIEPPGADRVVDVAELAAGS
jgi:hypothetical protein